MRPEQEWPSEVWWQLSEENLAAAERTMEDNGGQRTTVMACVATYGHVDQVA